MLFVENEVTVLKSKYTDNIKKEIIAFANTRGGTIYIGINDDGGVCGVENSDYLIQQVMNAARDSIKPDITLFMNVETLINEDKTIVAVYVQCGTHKPYYLATKGLRPEGVFVRRGNSSVPASDIAIRQMIKETDGDNYEDMRSLNQDLTFEKINIEFKKRNLLFTNVQMKTLGLIDSEGLYTNLALLFSDQCPHIIKAASFLGTNQDDFQDRREFTGSILKQLEDAYNYLDLRNKNIATFAELQRYDHKDYPEVAIREALLNAIVHRDYGISASTLLSIYSNRIELISIGGLAGGIAYDDMMLGISYCRNKKLADVFYRMGLIEAYGTGIKKIMSSYQNSFVKPEIIVSSGAFKFILPNQNIIVLNDVSKDSIKDNKEKLILNILSDKSFHSRLEFEKVLGVSTSTIRRILQKLIKEELVAIKGEGKNTLYYLK